VAEFLLSSQLSTELQGDLDMGWLNQDTRGGFGLPVARFSAWRPDAGFLTLSLSPRDANRNGARLLPGYDDGTFEPEALLPTYCGALDDITPARRGEFGTDKFFLYGTYLDVFEDCSELLANGLDFWEQLMSVDLTENGSLALLNAVLAVTPAGTGDALLGCYAVNDGLVPLQSQLMLDGTETELIYETHEAPQGPVIALPVAVRKALVAEHTLARPDRLRIVPGMSHVDIVFGGYDPGTGQSALFARVAGDLLSVVPGD
jgi:hypothetical protein